LKQQTNFKVKENKKEILEISTKLLNIITKHSLYMKNRKVKIQLIVLLLSTTLVYFTIIRTKRIKPLTIITGL